MTTNGKKERVQLSQRELLVICLLVLRDLRPQIEQGEQLDPEVASLFAKLTRAYVRRTKDARAGN